MAEQVVADLPPQPLIGRVQQAGQFRHGPRGVGLDRDHAGINGNGLAGVAVVDGCRMDRLGIWGGLISAVACTGTTYAPDGTRAEPGPGWAEL